MFYSVNIDLSPRRFLRPRLLAPQPEPASLAQWMPGLHEEVGFLVVVVGGSPVFCAFCCLICCWSSTNLQLDCWQAYMRKQAAEAR